MNTMVLALSMFAVQYALGFFIPGIRGYPGWLLFAFLIGRMVGIAHPPSQDETPLSTGRKILGWIALVIFVLCFTPNPLEVILIEP